jgi:DNA repair protein RecN (Recombination protein N)
MLVELRVRDLGVIEDLELVVGAGMTALTGETGAGKTLVVEALELLLGGRSDSTMVRAGANEAVVEGRFVRDEREVVLSRVVPANGRSRAYVDGRMAPVSMLSEISDDLVDLHGQHVHQSLLHRRAQREALDGFAGADLAPLALARRELSAIDERLAQLGGDLRERARRKELLDFECAEIAAAHITDADEEERIVSEEAVLAHVGALRWALAQARDALVGSDASQGGGTPGAIDLVGAGLEAIGDYEAFGDLAGALRATQAGLQDVAHEMRLKDEGLEEDPERLDALRTRLQLFSELRRKYGQSIADVLEFERAARLELAELSSTEETQAALEQRRIEAQAVLEREARKLGAVRREAASRLGKAIEVHLNELALGGARLEVRVGDDPDGSDVEYFFGANPGEPALPLSKVASGGELARCMLATRLVLSSAPPTLVFDEVDAGVGGEAALAVGRALCAIGRDHQVLVVTHLAQVAAFGDQQVVVTKTESKGRTVARARGVCDEERIVELSRMLSGHPDSTAARQHAKELLALGARSLLASGGSGNLGRYRDGRRA